MLILLIVSVLFLDTGTGRAASARITDIRIELEGNTTWITIESAGSLRAEAFTLGSPDRLVIDFSLVDWPEGARIRLPNGGLVGNIRYGRFDPNTSRLVMDLRGPAYVASTSSQSAGGGVNRLRLGLQPASGGQSMQGKVTIATASGGESISNVTQNNRGQADSAERLEETVATALVLPPAPPRHARTVIAVDAGHGGVDPGAIGPDGTPEKTITLTAAKELRRQLEATGRYDVVMTRTSDIYVSLSERVEIARQAGAQLFVSLHADKHDSPRLRGASIYTLSEKASDAETEAYARRENRADVVAGVALAEEYDEEVAKILFSLVQQSTMNCSALFASTLVDELGQHSRMLPKAHRFAGFRVLKAPDVPSVLIELGYLSNREDGRLLRNSSHISKLMRGVVSAISLYLKSDKC
ncbi:MAG: N-acetylmuramoyl-L-alanine amidase [Alphaproteobacteria bacterium]